MEYDFKLSDQVKKLKAQQLELAKHDGRKLLCEEEQKFYAQCKFESAVACRNKNIVIQRAEMLERFSAGYPISLNPLELIVGSQRFIRPVMNNYYTEQELKGLRLNGNHGHIIIDYSLLLNNGIDGTAELLKMMPECDNKVAMQRSLEAFRLFIRRHETAVAQKLAVHKPETFHEALQLVWFTQIFLHAEGDAAAVSFGRFDQYLCPFLENDLNNDIIDINRAFELLCSFFVKSCEGDESQNLTIGGCNPEGTGNAENPLSFMILRASALLQVWQPSISVRFGPFSTEEFIRESINLCAVGIGMPSFFNESVVARSLMAVGVSESDAYDWGIVGCYEAAIPGKSYPLTVASGVPMTNWIRQYCSNVAAPDSFEQFYDGFKEFISTKYGSEYLPCFQQRWDDMRENNSSPFESIFVSGCIESGLTAEEGGGLYNFYGVNLLGTGTVVDSLTAINELVFRKKSLSLSELSEQVENNFTDENLLMQCRNLPDKFGSNTERGNELAKDFSSFIARLVLEHPLKNGVRPYPGLFWFSADINQMLPATPDGRRDNDYISYGCGPGAFLPTVSPTDLLNSTAVLDHEHCGCGNPITLSMNYDDLKNEHGRNAMMQLVMGYFSQGGFHLHVNLAGPEELIEAQDHPEQYSELIVRVSGFSAAYVTLEERWQNALIERAKRGI